MASFILGGFHHWVLNASQKRSALADMANGDECNYRSPIWSQPASLPMLVVLARRNQKQGWRRRRGFWLEAQDEAALRTVESPAAEAPLQHLGDLGRLNDSLVAHGVPQASAPAAEKPLKIECVSIGPVISGDRHVSYSLDRRPSLALSGRLLSSRRKIRQGLLWTRKLR